MGKYLLVRGDIQPFSDPLFVGIDLSIGTNDDFELVITRQENDSNATQSVLQLYPQQILIGCIAYNGCVQTDFNNVFNPRFNDVAKLGEIFKYSVKRINNVVSYGYKSSLGKDLKVVGNNATAFTRWHNYCSESTLFYEESLYVNNILLHHLVSAGDYIFDDVTGIVYK